MGEDDEAEALAAEEQAVAVRAGRRRRLVVAVVVAAVLAAGGGTYLAVSAPYKGDSGVAGQYPECPSAGAKCALLATLPARPGAPAPPGTGYGTATAAPADPAPAPPGTYRLTGPLPVNGPGSAASYRPAGAVDGAAVVRLARTLGLKGPVQRDADGWRVGARDGSAPGLLVSTDASATWSYASNEGALPDARDTPVSEPRALAVAAPVLDTLGLTGTARVDASALAGTARTVRADPLVGGLPTHGWDTGVSVAADGRITSAHGRLASLVKGEAGAVVSATRAFAELPGPHLMHPGALACASGDAAVDTAEPRAVPCAAPHSVSVDITSAEFGLTLTLKSASAALTPAWLFTARPHGGGSPYVIPQPALS